MTRSSSFVAVIAIALTSCSVEAFSSTTSPNLFQEKTTQQRKTPSKQEGVEIELPDFEELFERIQRVSPLARQVIQGAGDNGERGFDHVDDKWPSDLKWKVVEDNKKRTVNQIDKIDNFMGLGPPILRYRSSLKGPCVGGVFANFIMDLSERSQWDPAISDVEELYPVYDLDTANIAMGFGKYGDCSKLGVGYCRTKAVLGIGGREQLTICGIQDFADGSCVIWGTEMEDWHNHLLPPIERQARAKSHLFSTTLTPTSDNTFDVEYVLQLDIGGNIPQFLTAPVVSETVKSLFKHAEKVYAGEEGSFIHNYMQEKANHDSLAERHSILMTP